MKKRTNLILTTVLTILILSVFIYESSARVTSNINSSSTNILKIYNSDSNNNNNNNLVSELLDVSLDLISTNTNISTSTTSSTNSNASDEISDIEETDTTENTDEIENKIPDTLSFRYKFVPGDSIYYSVFSSDSIIVNYDEPLLRLRRERLLITCDSINFKGNFCLTQRLVSFRSAESYKDEKNIEHTYSKWLNVPVYIELDSLGRRIKVFNADSNSAASSPGGVFQPILLMPLVLTNINKKAENESWLNSTTDYLVENAAPVPIFKSTTLMRLNGKYDTLGFNTLKFTFSRSGQGSHELVTDEYSMKTTGVINSGGELLLDTIYWIPVYISHTQDQKLNFYYPDGMEQPGWHFIKSTFVLEYIKRPDEIPQPNNTKKNATTKNIKKQKTGSK